MAYYDPSGHPLLGSTAAALESSDPVLFEQRANAAEFDLGLRDVRLTGDDYELAVQAVALLVRCMTDREQPVSTSSALVVSESEGDQSRQYKYDDRAASRGSEYDPCALAHRIAARLLDLVAPQGAGAYNVITSLR